MKKSDAIALLNKEGWTKADAQRVLKSLDFKRDNSINEITILRAASKFAGSELLERQRLQAAQKAQVTRKTNQIAKYIQQIKELENKKSNSPEVFNPDFQQQIKKLSDQNKELLKANRELQKDNKDLKNVTDAIKLRLTQETKHLLRLENSQIKKGLLRLLNSVLG